MCAVVRLVADEEEGWIAEKMEEDFWMYTGIVVDHIDIASSDIQYLDLL
jgi:hypothetical protein